MGRLCGGVQEISGIPAPLWLHGWVVGRVHGWVGVGVGGVVVGCACEGGWCGRHVCGGGVVGEGGSVCGVEVLWGVGG